MFLRSLRLRCRESPSTEVGCDVNIGEIERVIVIEPLIEPVEVPDRHEEAEPAPLRKGGVPA
jgi:hypothetical protein